nr:molecular chaperone [uncultured Pseudomonas sp.]
MSIISPSRLPARLIALALALLGAAAHAGVIINNTRIIYPQSDKEVTVRLESKNQAPVLVQVWLDSGDEHSSPDRAEAPFIATPPIFRMEPGKQQVVRLAYTGETLATEQESLFWFNLLEVPAHSREANQLQLAFRSRIKLFLRPPNLPYGVDAAPGKLQWRRESTPRGQVLDVYNPTPYHVTFEQVEVLESQQRHARKPAASSAGNMVAPGGRMRFELPSLKNPPGSAATVEFQTLDDYGVRNTHSTPIRT